MSYLYPPAYGGGYPAPGYCPYPAPAPPPPPMMGGPWMGYVGGPDYPPYGYGAASCAPAYPPSAASLYGGYSPAELYSHGQQYGMTPRDVDEALVEYHQLSRNSSSEGAQCEVPRSTDRGLLGDAILNFRLPSIMEFISLIGANKMQFVPVTTAVPVYQVPFGYPAPIEDKKKEDPSSQPATL